ncbi:BMP family protein [Aeromicrobium sp. CF4.19]|uniref:BMP family lipoprotein n=1 Tax=Aeromicrobium sp. CF4.19 TaxID=3373082 RepID=UPI003EE434AF
MRRLTSIAAGLAASGLVLTACGTAADDEGESAEEVQCETTQVEGEPKVGLAYDVGGRGDQSFNDSAYAGIERAVDDFGVEFTESEAGSEEDDSVREERLRTFADDGYNTIVGVGFAYSNAVNAVAPDYPNVAFGVIDGFDPDADPDSGEIAPDAVNCNVAYLTFAENEGSFLAGAAAALESETGTVGFVGGVNNELINKFLAGYQAGAEAADPEIEVLTAFVDEADPDIGFGSPDIAKGAADAQFQDGADVVFHAAGGSGAGVFDAAVEADASSIGVDSDQFETASEEQRQTIITSMVKRVDTATYDFIQSVVDGEPDANFTTFDLASEGVGYSTSGDFLSDETISELDDFQQQIIDGEIEVPAAP